MSGWIGVDLDGTLSLYDGWRGMDHIGPPVPLMLARVQRWLETDLDVRIVTARAADPAGVRAVEAWCLTYLGRKLPVTDRKDFGMIALWDDRAVSVESNTGVVIKRVWPPEILGLF